MDIYDEITSQTSSIVAAFMSWLQFNANMIENKNNVFCWVVEMHQKNTIDIIHCNEFEAAIHGMMGFEDDTWRFDAIQQCMNDWCDDIHHNEYFSNDIISNISVHVSKWGPLAIQELQWGQCTAVMQTIDIKIRNMTEVMIEYPEEYLDHVDNYIKVLQYQSLINMCEARPACMTA